MLEKVRIGRERENAEGRGVVSYHIRLCQGELDQQSRVRGVFAGQES